MKPAGMRAAILRAVGWSDDGGDTGDFRIALAAEEVDYRVVRARRRSIGIRIGAGGITVRAPHGASRRAIEAALREHAAWVREKLAVWQSRRRDIVPALWIRGATIAYRGQILSLSLSSARRKQVRVDRAVFSIAHPTPDDEPAVAAYAKAWLRRETLRFVAPDVADLARRIGMPAPSLRLSSARTRWGSCNARGEIRLNAGLVHVPPDLARYVVAHEIAHLVHLDHSPRFWALLGALYERHRGAKRELAQWAAALEA